MMDLSGKEKAFQQRPQGLSQIWAAKAHKWTKREQERKEKSDKLKQLSDEAGKRVIRQREGF